MMWGTLFSFLLLGFSIWATTVDIDIQNITEEVYQDWGTYTLPEKLPYLLDSHMKASFAAEFDTWLSYHKNSGETVQREIDVGVLQSRLSEFITEEEIQHYISECDVNLNKHIDIMEYVLCRGDYNSYFTPNGHSEYDMLESIIINDYEEKRNDPNFMIPGVIYDENGIIVD
mmetsp:Transcript_63211/g.124503  ORF Transcript_63211/g.124503 Transcript_63211/m.124503 type:complete len:172 (-) Transcript_63211:127-642(-)